jgi:hypothetical protein
MVFEIFGYDKLSVLCFKAEDLFVEAAVLTRYCAVCKNGCVLTLADHTLFRVLGGEFCATGESGAADSPKKSIFSCN